MLRGGRILKPTISTLAGPFWMTADTTPDNIQGHSVHGEPTEPIVALPGVGGHSVHGHEGPEGNVHRSMVVDRIGLRIGGDEMKLPLIQ